jgi:tetratricopeptide (TPR) repeat protein
MKWRPFALGCTLGVATAPGALATPFVDPADTLAIADIRAKSPHAAKLLDQGEALMASGHVKEAQALFQQSHTEYPEGSILWRRDCEALVILGRREAATNACSTALGTWRSGENLRALVRALVEGPTPPTTAQLMEALQIVSHERHFGPSITTAAAACNIAETIGDNAMLQGCAEELTRINPDHPLTRDALARLAARCPPGRFWAGWAAIFAAVVGTLVHALWRRAGGVRAKRAAVTAVALLAIAVGSWPRTAAADDDPTKWLSKRHVDDEHPDSNIPTDAERNADPLEFGYWLQDVALKGEHASKRGNHYAAARFYDTLIKAVPDRAIGYVKACEEYKAAGAMDQAINRCGQALLFDGLRVHDYVEFIDLVVSKPGKLSDKEVGALGQVIEHMKNDPAAQPWIDDLECEVGARTANVAQLKECTSGLAVHKPTAPKTISYEWALAMASGDSRSAETILGTASAAGVAPADIEEMKKQIAALRMRSALRITAITAAVGLLLAGIAVALRALLARRRPAIPAVG